MASRDTIVLKKTSRLRVFAVQSPTTNLSNMRPRLLTLTALLIGPLVPTFAAEPVWKKHTVCEDKGRMITTATAGDYSGDGKADVITSYSGQVSLFTAPDWKETLIRSLPGPGRGQCIHSESFDVDGDGDLDWLGSLASGKPFWLENPGKTTAIPWTSHLIDPDIRGIHCFLKADVDKDGRLDLIINNFQPEGPLSNSIAWFSIPKNLKEAPHWDRHVFAKEDAGGGSHYFGFGDLDGDGWSEITVGAKGKPFENGNWFAYWKNPGAEKVKQAWSRVTVAENEAGATNILPGDLNGDGNPDLLASNGHGLGVFWFQAPNWKKNLIDDEMSSPHSLALADLDQDGDLDAASCGFKSERLSIYLNDGKGQFKRHDLDTAQQSYDLRTFDMDGDGDLDLLNAGRATKNVAWYENPLR
ncbi:VCBS repeat-containing protein [bacterium]|nr:VCBS repeat-containing protein [bacterium]MDA8980650.1 VCBS repeat-containing protein [bacterium]